MIGVFQTTHPTEGYGLVVRYTKVDRSIRITGITMAGGKDAWGSLTSEQIQIIKSKIPA